MNIPNYDIDDDKENNFIKVYLCMPQDIFRMLIISPPGEEKTNLLYHMVMVPMLFS